MNTFLGIELGSTRIKAVTIDETYKPIAGGDYIWESAYKDGIWTYDLADVWAGLNEAIFETPNREQIRCMGISAMMHGYLAFDENWNLLVPFRTWQNTITGQAAAALTESLGFNIPQRWSIAHLYQAVLNGEAHVPKIAHITTLAGYVHFMLTGENVLGVGDASGMFPIDSQTCDYDAAMLDKFAALTKERPWDIRDLLPRVLPAGAKAGCLTQEGAARIDHMLPVGLAFAPPEGDAGTGMTATNAVAVGTGNVSAGTSIFAMVVMEEELARVYEEIDMVTTPSGKPVAMVHCNNCTGDFNAWAKLLQETAALFGINVSNGDLYTKLFEKSLEGDADCSGILTYNYLAGEGVTHLDAGRPVVVRNPESRFTLANFLRSGLYATMATLAVGMEILNQEDVNIHRLMGHGGLFKTPVVGQTYLSAACEAPVTCMETAGEGGPYGMALLAAYAANAQGSLEDFLENEVFADCASVTIEANEADIAAFRKFLQMYKAGLAVEKAAVENL